MKIRTFSALFPVVCILLMLSGLCQSAFAISLSATADSRSGSITLNIGGLASDPYCGSLNKVTLTESKSGTPGFTATEVAGGQLRLYRETGTYTFFATQKRADYTSTSGPYGAVYSCVERSSSDYTLSLTLTLNRENPAQFDNLRPFVTINSPAAGQSLVAATTYAVTIGAVDTGGSISRVEVRDGSTLIGQATAGANSTYTINWTPTTSSSTPVYKVLTATAVDNQGASTSVSQTYLVSQSGVVATTNQAIDFSKYDVYYGDFNADGNTNDIYLYGRDTFILLYGDVSVPIILQGPPSYVFYEKSDHSHDDAEILEFADYSWQASAIKAAAQDVAVGDLNSDGTPDLLIRGRGQYDTALLVNGKFIQDGADLVPAYMGDVDSDGRVYTRGKGWSTNPVVNGNLSDRNQAISLSAGKLSVAGKLYVYNASSTLVPDAGTAAAASNVPTPPAPAVAQPTLNAQDQQTMDSLGILSGQFRVSEAGAATYNLPLKLPQGTAGVAPEVSIGYSSQSGDGLMGLGWSLNAGGAISRCRQTLQIDKVALPITWTSTDRYCLNGQRLLVVSGVYGAADSQYKTEMDSQVVVTQKGGSNGSADYFEVKAKDGSTSIYGVSGTDASEEKGYPSSTASCQTVASNGSCADKVMTWNLTQFSDSVGNKIQYNYENATTTDQKSYRLSSISYAYVNSQSNARIKLIYEAGRKETSLAAGYKFYRDSRLASVETYQTISGENLLRKYSFNYNTDLIRSFSDGRDRLTSILECSSESCLPPLRMTWGDTMVFAPATTSVDLKAGFYIDSSFGPNYLDVNGDGRLDFVTLDKGTSDKNYKMRFALQKADGTFSWGTFKEGTSNLGLMVHFPVTANGQDNLPQYKMNVRTYPVDVNNDGRSDVITFVKESYSWSWQLYLSTPSTDAFPNDWMLVKYSSAQFSLPFGNVSVSDSVQFGDLDSDGLTDAYFIENGRIYVSYLRRNSNPAGSNMPYSFQSPVDRGAANGVTTTKLIPGGDFNGDGRLDLIGSRDSVPGGCSYQSAFTVFFQDSLSNFSSSITLSSCGVSGETKAENISVVDVNGDGASDLAWTMNSDSGVFSKIYVSYGDGKAGLSTPTTYPLATSGAASLQFGDSNRNGKLEALVNYPSSNRVLVYEWDNGVFPATPGWIDPSTADADTRTQFLDVNADGSQDRVETTKDFVYFYKGEKTLTDGLVTSFTSGRGVKTAVQYEPLGTTPNYTKISNIGITTGTTTVLEQKETCAYVAIDPGCSKKVGVISTVPTVNFADFYSYIVQPFSDATYSYGLGLDSVIPTMEYTGAIPVVTLVSSSAPSNADPNSMAKVSYFYGQAKMQAGGRGLLGFKTLSTVDVQTGVNTTTTYRQDWPFIGSPVSTVTYTKEGNKLSESKNTYLIYGIAQGDLAAKKTAAIASGTQVLGPIQTYANSSTETTYDLVSNGATQGAIMAQNVTNIENDAYGNVVNLTVTTHDSASANGGAAPALAVKQTVNAYSDDAAWKSLGRLMASTVTSKRRGQPDKILSSKFGYFGVPAGEGLSCSDSDSLKGMLCKELVVQSGVTTQHYYDAFGNKIFSYSQGGGLARLSPLSLYDATGRFPEASYGVFNSPGSNASPNTEYNGLAASTGGRVFKVSEVVQRDKHGLALQTHNYNGGSTYTVSRTAVTPMGIPFFSADSSGASQEIKTALDTTDCPSNSLYSTTKSIGGGAKTRVCYNKVGQELRAMTQGFDGTWTFVDKQYDVLGRVTKSSEPYKSTGTAYYTEVDSYDILGRPGKTWLPFNVTTADGTETTTRASTTVTYSGYQQTLVNPAGNTKVEVKNPLGQVVSVTEPHGANGEAVTATYSYDAQGNLVQLVDPASNTSTLEYDALGRKTKMIDPDKGTWEYRYNAFGELVCQQDAKGQIQSTDYDFAGRPTQRLSREPGGNCAGTPNGAIKAQSQWIYDTAPYGLGKAEVERDLISGFARTYGYDALGRASLTTTTFNGANSAPSTHYEKVTYDQYGRVFQSFDAARQGKDFSRNGVQNNYTALGFLQEVKDATGNDTYYKVLAADARGNVTQYQMAGGVTTATQAFNPKTGRLETITTTGAANVTLEQYTAKWDTLGNLASRSETKYTAAAQNWMESFSYDKANRLRSNTFTPGSGTATTTSITYDAIGNITSKSGVGSYAYSRVNAGAHAVTSAGGNTYTYDANGSMTATTGADARTVTYTTDDQAQMISKGDQRSSFFYGPDKARYKRVDTKISTNASTTTLYIGGVEKIYYPDGQIEWKRNIAGVGQITIKVDGSGNEQSRTTHYFHKDHLGSILYISNSTGSIVQEMAYDPWGQRRAVSSPTPLTLATLQSSYFKASKPVTQRGFTGHEMIDEVGIIHMNGRIYDAKLGRFMQADPFIQAPTMIGSLNRYSYCMNNPLNATDPSGFFWGEKYISKAYTQHIKTNGVWMSHKLLNDYAPGAAPVIAAGLNYVPYCGWILSAAFSANNAFYLSGGDVDAGGRAMLAGTVSHYAFTQIGQYFANASTTGACTVGTNYYNFGGNIMSSGQIAAQIAAHAVAGGVISVIEGGKFGHGFISAGVTKGIMGTFNYADLSTSAVAGRTAAAFVIGGTTSVMSGGKFANGAITAAMAQLYNAERSNKNRITEERAKQLSAGLDKWLKESYPGFPSTIDIYTEVGIPVDAAPPPNFNILSLNVSEDQFISLSIHEKLHVYIFKEMGFVPYLFSSNQQEIHNWIGQTGNDLANHYLRYIPTGGKSLPDLKSYPTQKFPPENLY